MSETQELEVEIERLAAENEQLIEAAKKDWAKHGGTEIALGQWKARALAAEAERDALRSALFAIAHTETENSFGGSTNLPASWYRDCARKALEASK